MNVFASSDPLMREGLTKLCRDCTNYVAPDECAANGQILVSFISGQQSPSNDKCEAMRRSGQLCGPEGKLFSNEAAISVDPIKAL